MLRTNTVTKSLPSSSRVSYIKWTPSHILWTKLNTDWCSKGNPGYARSGGVLWDFDGSWICRQVRLENGCMIFQAFECYLNFFLCVLNAFHYLATMVVGKIKVRNLLDLDAQKV